MAAAASSDVERTASASEGSSRRGVMRLALGSAAWLGGGGGGGGGGWVAVAAEAEGLQSLADYRAALDRAKLELDGIANDLRASAGSSANVFAIIIEENELEDQFDEPPAVVPLSPSARAGLKARLHDGELGRAGQISLATSLDASQLMKRGFKMRWETWRGEHCLSGPRARAVLGHVAGHRPVHDGDAAGGVRARPGGHVAGAYTRPLHSST